MNLLRGLSSIAKYGLPWPADNVVLNPGWVGAYDTSRRNPRFVQYSVSYARALASKSMRDFEIVSEGNIPECNHQDQLLIPSRKFEKFFGDPLFPRHLRASPSDFSHSGYDRGHLMPVVRYLWPRFFHSLLGRLALLRQMSSFCLKQLSKVHFRYQM